MIETEAGAAAAAAAIPRVADKSWCTCLKCELMPTEVECYCCHEWDLVMPEIQNLSIDEDVGGPCIAIMLVLFISQQALPVTAGRYRKVVGQMEININRLKNSVKFVKNVLLGIKETEEKFYLLVKEARRYRDALMNCKLRGGTLAMPKNTNTKTLLSGYISEASLTHVFIGLRSAEAGGGYVFADGGALINSTAWGLEVPSVVSNSSCVQMGSSGAWSQTECDTAKYFICEFSRK
uniref:Collectin subfamily member 10 n=1 Tax=Astyanax mexicanus TaxID=7994 RepID=A0A3B1IQP1_ASTMX